MPSENRNANAYVQVTNKGRVGVENVRVFALFTPAAAGVPDLPTNIWDVVAAYRDNGDTNVCQQLEAGPWRPVGSGCTTIPLVSPGVPEVAQFQWTPVPGDAAEHSCFVTIIDSDADPIPASATGVLSIGTLAPYYRHVAQRNLLILDEASADDLSQPVPGPEPGPEPAPQPWDPTPGHRGVTTILVYPDGTSPERTVKISTVGMGNRGSVGIMLPPGLSDSATGLPPQCGQVPSASGGSSVGFVLPMGVTAGGTALLASEQLTLRDGAKIKNLDGTDFVDVASTGSLDTELGVEAEVGTLVSQGPIELRDRVHVHGQARSAVSIVEYNDVSIDDGGVAPVAVLPGSDRFWTIEEPGPFIGSVQLEPGQTGSISPGSYDSLIVKSDATLTMAAGTYFVDHLQTEPNAILDMKTSGGAVVIYVADTLMLNGTNVDEAGAGENVLVVYDGADPTFLDYPPFRGTLLAPNAVLTIGGNSPHFGSFIAKSIEVRANAEVRHVAFAQGSGGVGGCQSLSQPELNKAAREGLDPTEVFGVVDNEATFTLSFPTSDPIKLGIRYDSGKGYLQTAQRFKVTTLDSSGEVAGGVTFVVRHTNAKLTVEQAAECTVDAECDDGNFCNGAERCINGRCGTATTLPCNPDGISCTIESCDETTDSCLQTVNHAACNNGLFCDGSEVCSPGVGCISGSAACPTSECDEATDTCGVGCQPTTLEAEAMFHSTGSAVADGWALFSNGYMSENHEFTGAESSITIRARGSSFFGTWPHMVVSVAGEQVGDVFVDSTDWQTYTFNFTAPTGSQEVRISYDNDSFYRALYVDHAFIECGAGAGASCNDGIQNQGETGVDCGGPCPACPTCNDGVQNQGEAGLDCGGPCPACCQPATYQAEDMFHSTGGPAIDGWNIWDNGYISTNHTFVGGGETVTVTASGSQALGIWPHMVVSVDGVTVGDVYVQTTSFQDYTFNVNTSPGSQEIRVTFDNDYYSPPDDRNLFVDKVQVDCP